MSIETQQTDLKSTFRQFRQQAGLKQAELANAAGITRESYLRWESGRWSSLATPSMLKMAGLLCTHLPSDLDQKALMEKLVHEVPRSTIVELKTSLVYDLFLVEQVEEELLRLETYQITP